ncbi:MAG: glycosyltransferase [Roseovarius sp.]|jgi:2-polyprenyl-3-methyl-5-hydroxy-6-metoxy-1,4-benzoquinol methylase/glycosyltransferase involved in cell wall biosynthesis|nr:glycosyltransferase [Roseovarius sp.]
MCAALITSAAASEVHKQENSVGLPMVRDHVARVYLGKWGAQAAIEETRQRIHWIAAQVRGTRVLDVGTSEGILPVLLGREGFQVVGIDINAEAITQAQTILAAEAETVRERVEFRNTSLFQDKVEVPFDTVVLGNVLAHVSNISNFLRMAVGHLDDGGRLILTTPFGVQPHPDIKHSFLLSDIEQALNGFGKIELLDVSDGHIRAILLKDAVDTAEGTSLVTPLLAQTERAIFEAQTHLWRRISDAEALLQQVSEERENELQRATRAERAYQELKLEFDQRLTEFESQKDQLQILNTNLRRAEAGQQDEKLSAEQAREQFIASRADLTTEKKLHEATVERLTEWKQRLNDLVAESAVLQKQNARLSEDLSAAQAAGAASEDQLATLQEAYLYLEEKNRALSHQVDEADLKRSAAGEVEKLRDTAEDSSAQELLEQADRLGGIIGHLVRNLEGDIGQAAEQCLQYARDLRRDDPETSCCLTAIANDLVPGGWATKAHGFSLLQAGFPARAMEILRQVQGEDALGFSSLEQRQFDKLVVAAETEDWDRVANIADHKLTGSPLRVATIMDEFTYNSYAPECDLMQLTPEAWGQELSNFMPEMLLIESAWRGKGEKWGSKVGHLSSELRHIISWCKERGIPTVFWNKEDPVHFETFLTTANQFDMVCTTDIDCIGRYKTALGHDRVYFLPFACQPEVHNPIELYNRKDAFCFAGAYYVRYPHRTRDLEGFVEGLPDFRPIEIFDRNFGKDHPDYMFPEAYQKYIVGSLPPEQIDRAYKGYRFGINLNSIKNSQTMFARRVYELLASNTVTISNYSRGVRHMFGDLVISSDNSNEILRRLQEADLERLRLAGLRKVMLEHTYGVRMAYIAGKLGFETGGNNLPPVTVVAYAGSRADVSAIQAQVDRQKDVSATLVLVLASDIADLADEITTDTVMALPEARAEALHLGDVTPDDARIAPMVAGDYYGEHYLLDLVLATRYSTAAVIGKTAYHALTDQTPVLSNPDAAYRPADSVMLRRSLLERRLVAAEPLAFWARALPGAWLAAGPGDGLGIDAFNYCEEGSGADGAPRPGVAQIVDDLPGLDAGCALSELVVNAENTAPAQGMVIAAPVVEGRRLLDNVPAVADGSVTWKADGKDLFISSTLPEGKHVYLYQTEEHAIGDVVQDGPLRVFIETTPGLNLQWAMIFLDENKQRLGHVMAFANRNTLAEPPEGTVWVHFGLRVYASGQATVRRLILGERPPCPTPILSKARTLVLTNHYPSYEDIYRNGFVHSRVKAYLTRDQKVDVFRLRPDHDLAFHEFENVDCMTGSPEQLDMMLGQGIYETVCVHFLDEAMWDVLQPHLAAGLRVIVWMHGSEVQPWWRRAFNYSSDAEREAAKEISDRRISFWHGVLANQPANLHLVFVSQYLAGQVMEDLGVTLPESGYSIIHNPIDTDLFRFIPKKPTQRLKILSIRPFASQTYANDLTVKAIEQLRDKPFFDDLEFRIIGRGPLFADTLKPLAGLGNVIAQERFLPQGEIAALHRTYGIFLCPSRMDSQGVSRDEAMSSGLVPVTTDVAAIPEFVDESCGFMAEAEDASGLAQAIETLYHDPERFLALSEAAAERVRGQSAMNTIIAMELRLIRQSS